MVELPRLCSPSALKFLLAKFVLPTFFVFQTIPEKIDLKNIVGNDLIEWQMKEETRKQQLWDSFLSRQLASCWVPYIYVSISNFDDKPVRISLSLFFTETTVKSQ